MVGWLIAGGVVLLLVLLIVLECWIAKSENFTSLVSSGRFSFVERDVFHLLIQRI